MTNGRSETPRRSRRWRILLVSLSPCLLVLIAAWWFWHRERVPEPPEVSLTSVDAAVVAAVEVAREKVRDSPRSADAWGLLGMVLVANDFRAPALVCLAEAERFAPQEPRWPYYQGVALYLGDPDAALPKLRRAVELRGDGVPP